jgi:hypothetical protein
MLICIGAGLPKAYVSLRRPICSRAAVVVPGWSMWLRLETEYHEDEVGPILFIHRFDELSGNEFEQSLLAAKSMPSRINPSNS